MVPTVIQWMFVAVILQVASWCRAELYTAISDVEPLLETHKRIIDDLDFYIEKEEQRLRILKRHLNHYKQEHDIAMEDIPNYLGNPINAFALIKRLTTDLDLIEDSIRIGTDYIKNITMNHEDVKYPTMEDLTGAAQALTRLQRTYLLNVRDLSEGILNGVVYSTPLSAGDCYELGRSLYNNKDHEHALAWMLEAHRKYQEEPDKDIMHFNEVDIIEYIGFSHYLLGNTKEGLKWTYKLLELDPTHSRALGNVPHFKKLIEEEDAKERKRRRGDIGEPEQDIKVVETTKENESSGYNYTSYMASYESLCRGEMDVAPDIANKLKCWYSSEHHPFLKYAPLKMEQMYIKPDIFMFHDVIYDREIEVIKSLAKPKFKRAVVHDPATGVLLPAFYRISKVSWLRNEEDSVIARLSRRVTDMTGLSMESAEDLQVVNYGIGGQYEPHFDFSRRREKAFTNFEGNRIATVLFYMSDVAQGGATVFTELGLSLYPKKGAAAVWLNLHPSGEGDMATRHAACPVLRGSKWVCNKWLHQGGQELLRPCTLEYQDEGIARQLPRPVNKSSR